MRWPYLALGALLIGGCDSLWSGTLTTNPRNCVSNPMACEPDERCNQTTEICEKIPLALDSVTPILTPRAGGERLTLHGHGFAAPMSIELAGVTIPAEQINIISESELSFPAPPRTRNCGPVLITLSKIGGETVARGDLLRYYLPTLSFGEPLLVPIAPAFVNTLDVGAADMNRDGKQDLVVVLNDPIDRRNGQIGVLLANGDGSFAPIRSTVSAEHIFSLAFMDWNGDGQLDVLAGTIGTSVLYLRGQGDGSLQVAAQNISNQTFALQSVLALDLGAMQPPTLLGLGESLVRFQNDHGLLRIKVGAKSDASSQLAALGDVNGDHIADVVQTYFSNPPRPPDLFLGLGDGQFATGVPLPMANYFTSAAIGDINGDGWADVLMANPNQGLLAVLPNRGDGSFFTPETYPSASARIVKLADLNCDGLPDMAVANERRNFGSFAQNLGNGKFALPRIIPLVGESFTVTVADVNGDQAPDLAFGFVGTTTLSVVLNDSR